MSMNMTNSDSTINLDMNLQAMHQNDGGVWLSEDAALWAKRRWQELVVEKGESPMDIMQRLKSCIGFCDEWIVYRHESSEDKQASENNLEMRQAG